MTRRFLCVLVTLGVLTASAQTPGTRRYPLAEHGAIVLAAPDGWRDEVRNPIPGLPPTIVFHSSSGPGFRLLVTPTWPANLDTPRPTAEAVRESACRAAAAVRSQAVETEIAMKEFKGPEAFGSYFTLTDRAPRPGEYKYMTQGVMGLADLRVTFTVLTNDGGEAIVTQALDMLKGARRDSGDGNAR
jgi:hypothetical protein